MDDAAKPDKRMRLRYADTCRICQAELPARAEAIYEPASKSVRCLTHADTGASNPDASAPQVPAPVDVGTPGASARREHERRHQRREESIRTKHPKLGGLILGLTDDPQTTKAWHTGALGEERLGAKLNELSNDTLRVLHDRRIPSSRANIDHVAITPTGIWVIDAKKYNGRPHLKVEGGLLRARTERLLVGTRDCTKVVEGVRKQVDVIENVLNSNGPEGPGRPYGRVPVHGILCFVEADWPLIGGAFTTQGVKVLWPKKLYPQLQEPGNLEASVIDALHRALAAALPPA